PLKKSAQLARQDHELGAEEIHSLLTAIGVDPFALLFMVPAGPLYRVLDASHPHMLKGGRLMLALKDAGTVNGRRVDGFEFMATGSLKYDIRYVSCERPPEEIPDALFLQGAELIHTDQDVTEADGGPIGAIERTLGLAIRNPDPVRVAAMRRKNMERCQC